MFVNFDNSYKFVKPIHDSASVLYPLVKFSHRVVSFRTV